MAGGGWVANVKRSAPMLTSRQTRSPDERRADGRSRRKAAPRSSFAEWRPNPERPDPVQLLEEGAVTRLPELVPIRHGRMLSSPFAFFRGGAELMAADLADVGVSGISSQLCGDAHLSNFGVFAAPDRTLVFDCNDFDETIPGPWEWDVMRLAASFEVAGRSLGLDKSQRRAIVTAGIGEYRTRMAVLADEGNLEVWYQRLAIDDAIMHYGDEVDARARKRFRRNRAKAVAKDSLRALSKLTERRDGALRFRSKPPLLVPAAELADDRGAEEVEAIAVRLLGVYRDTLSDAAGSLLDGYRYVDLARKVVGVGSVGTRCWVVLLVGRDEGDPLFLQIKEAGPSALASHLPASRFRHQGRRVVEGQRLMQATGDILLGWLTAEGIDGQRRQFYVRQLWDGKASAAIELMDAGLLGAYAKLCGGTLARAHARGGDRVAIAGYLGSGDNFDRSMARFARSYADQNERDYEAFAAAVASGRLAAERDV